MNDPTPALLSTRLSGPAGTLLLAATGFVDAYVFIAHGRVFAEAQTGNLVLTAVGVFNPELVDFWRPLVAYAAFVVGVAVAWSLSRTGGGRARHAQYATLVVQLVVLATVAFLPDGFPNPVIVVAIAFGAGLQGASFNQVGRVAFTTVVMTSNTVHAVTTALRAYAGGEASERGDAVRLGAALAAFVAGVLAGSAATHWQGGRAAIYPAAAYLVVLALYLRVRHAVR